MATDPIICDWCANAATRVPAHGGTEPMCDAHARMNYGDDWRRETWVLGVRARKAIERERNA